MKALPTPDDPDEDLDSLCNSFLSDLPDPDDDDMTQTKIKLPKSFSPSPKRLEPVSRECLALGLAMVLAWERVSRRSSILGAFDDEIAEIFGWPSELICALTPARNSTLRGLLRKRLKDLQKGKLDSRLESNLSLLSERLGLSPADRALLRLAVLTQLHNVPHSIAESIRFSAPRQFCTFLASLTGLSLSQVEIAVRDDSMLLKTGLLDADSFLDPRNCFDSRLDLVKGLATQLAEGDFAANGVKSPDVAPMPKAKLQLSQYPHLEKEASLVRNILQAGLASKATGINILLYGAPGTGKTELARALVAAVAGSGFEIKSQEEDRSGSDGVARLRKFALAQRLLNGSSGHVVLFDEIEDVLASEGDWGLFMFGAGQGLSPRKAWKISLLESNAVPTIWTCNSILRIDPALQRRFTYCLEVPVPPRSVRLNMLQGIKQVGATPDSLLGKLADNDGLTPADVERVNRVLTLCPPSTPEEWRERVLLTLGARPDGVDTSALAQNRTSCEIRYEPKWINAFPSVADVAERLQHAGEGRLCFAGPTGTGKTAFAKHLAQKLDRPLISKKASDLLSPWLGETEGKLAAAFKEARRDNAVLLIDEADSFLQDRRNATRSWEITQVNEVLKQLEEHAGYVILSTNLYDHLDQAVLRRLDVKVTFGYLDPHHLPQVFHAAAEGMAIDGEEVGEYCASAQWSGLKDLAMGDVAVAMRQVRLTSGRPSPDGLFNALRDQLEHRNRLQGRKIGF